MLIESHIPLQPLSVQNKSNSLDVNPLDELLRKKFSNYIVLEGNNHKDINATFENILILGDNHALINSSCGNIVTKGSNNGDVLSTHGYICMLGENYSPLKTVHGVIIIGGDNFTGIHTYCKIIVIIGGEDRGYTYKISIIKTYDSYVYGIDQKKGRTWHDGRKNDSR